MDTKLILLAHLPVFALVLARVAGLFVFAPIWGGAATGWKFKAMTALVIGSCLYPIVMANVLGVPQGLNVSLWVLPVLIFMEVMVGLAIGYGASLPVMAFKQAGAMMDFQLGMGIATGDDESGEFAGGALTRFCMFTALAMFVIMGGHRVLFLILAGSFEQIPLGGFRVDGALMPLMTGLLAAMFELALRIAAPLLCLVFVQLLVLGMIARTTPTINVFSVGIPLRILLVIAALAVAIGAILGVYTGAVQETLDELTRLFAG